jgi:hypothetical protein
VAQQRTQGPIEDAPPGFGAASSNWWLAPKPLIWNPAGNMRLKRRSAISRASSSFNTNPLLENPALSMESPTFAYRTPGKKPIGQMQNLSCTP